MQAELRAVSGLPLFFLFLSPIHIDGGLGG